MAEIQVFVSKDKFEARISINSIKDSFPEKAEILKSIESKGVVYGIDEQIVDKIALDKKPINFALVAKGDLPQQGRRAELMWQIEIDYSSKPTITESDKADFKKLKLFERVKKDQVLVSKLPATEGRPGKNVYGEEIVDQGGDVKLPAGKNTAISADGLTLKSVINGYAYWDDDLLCIDDVYRVSGNVDYHTGNVKANGSVLIEGDVRSGFRVEATESIIIKGNIEASSVYSQNGDISVACGILGGGKAKILAGGNLKSGFIQDATVSVKGDIIVKHYVINSQLSSGGKVLLNSNEGLIRGGIISSGTGISCLEVGSEQKIYTELNIRMSDFYKEYSKSWNIGSRKKEISIQLDQYKKRQEFLLLLQNRVKDLSPQKKEELKEVQTQINTLTEQLEDLKNEDLQIREEATREIKRNEIIIANKLYENVNIDFGGIEYFSNEIKSNVKFFREENEIVIEPIT